MAAEPRLTALELSHAAAVVGPDPAADSWTPISAGDIPDTEPIRPVLADTGLIYPGKRHVFSGPPESAKTLAAYCVLIQTARVGQTGMLIDFEMGPREAKQRLRELGATDQELGRILYVEPNEPSNIQRVAHLVSYQPVVVVIDAAAGAYSLEGLDDNKRQDVERFARNYVTIFWRNGIATILIDHVVKDSETRGRFAIGSERKLGGADVHFGFDIGKSISRGTNGVYTIHNHKDRAGYMTRGHMADLHLDSDPETHSISWRFTDPQQNVAKAGYYRPTGQMERVSIDLELRSEPVSRNTIYDAVAGSRRYLVKAIDALVREGFVTERAGAGNSKLLESTLPFREKDHPDPSDSGSGSSLVHVWFHSGSLNDTGSGSSLVPSPYGGGTAGTTHDDPPEPQGWFTEDGELAGDEWLASMDPGDDIDFDRDNGA